MKVGIYNPHLATLGGGEHMTAVLASTLATRFDAEVELIAHDDEGVGPAHLTDRFDVDLRGVGLRFMPGRRAGLGLLAHQRRLSDLTRTYDLFVSMAFTGMVPCRARRSLYVCMFPMGRRPGWAGALRERYRARALGTYTRIVAISDFTQAWIVRRWRAESTLLHPPVAVSPTLELADKRPVVLSVGRFFLDGHAKNHRLMIEAFRHLVDEGLAGWELHLVGGVAEAPGTRAYLEQLQTLAAGYPVRFHFDAPAQMLRALRRESSMFWHAAGHGVDAERTPERLEHFGIATVEAMNSGAVPLVFGRGGPTEVVTHGRDGFLWHTPAELAEHTLALAHDEAARRRFAHEAHASSLRFGRDVFADTLEALVRDMMASPSGRSLR